MGAELSAGYMEPEIEAAMTAGYIKPEMETVVMCC
jgi:hypothetical protein